MQDEFFLQLLDKLHEAGCPCAITGGLACVEFGIVEHTSDCDVLCRPEKAEDLLRVLAESEWLGKGCLFRGSMSAPLATAWLEGGWTSHFSWGEQVYLDVFGAPPRIAQPWSMDTPGPYASRDQVASMKRTRRLKDWGQATALGLQMLQAGQQKGWLHLFDPQVMQDAWREAPPSAKLVKLRPALQLVGEQSRLLARVVRTEIEFWTELDRLRIRAFTNAVKPYAALVRGHQGLDTLSLIEQNKVRLECAERALPKSPLTAERISEMTLEAKELVGVGLSPEILDFLPAVGPDFIYKGDDE
jgi:hypothetical protein